MVWGCGRGLWGLPVPAARAAAAPAAAQMLWRQSKGVATLCGKALWASDPAAPPKRASPSLDPQTPAPLCIPSLPLTRAACTLCARRHPPALEAQGADEAAPPSQRPESGPKSKSKSKEAPKEEAPKKEAPK